MVYMGFMVSKFRTISLKNCVNTTHSGVGIRPEIAETLEIRRFLNLKMRSDCKMTAAI